MIDDDTSVAAGSDRPRGRHRRGKMTRRRWWHWKSHHDVSSDAVEDSKTRVHAGHSEQCVADTATLRALPASGDVETHRTHTLSRYAHLDIDTQEFPRLTLDDHTSTSRLPRGTRERDTARTYVDLRTSEHTSDGRQTHTYDERARSVTALPAGAPEDDSALRTFVEADTTFFDNVSRYVSSHSFRGKSVTVDPRVVRSAMAPAVVRVIRYCVHCGTMRTGVVLHDASRDLWVCALCSNAS